MITMLVRLLEAASLLTMLYVVLLALYYVALWGIMGIVDALGHANSAFIEWAERELENRTLFKFGGNNEQ